MMNLLADVARLGDFAEGQFGCFTVAQAAGVGWDRDRLAAAAEVGLVEQVTPQVWRLRAGGRHAFPQLYGAWLALQPQIPAWEREPPGCGVVSHGAALRLFAVGDQPGPQVEFTAPAVVTAADDVVVHVAALADDEWCDVAGMPTTTPARTLWDLSPRLDAGELARLGEALVAHRWVNRQRLIDDLESQMSRHPEDGQRHALLRVVVDMLAA